MSPAGDDSASGAEKSPLKSLAEAQKRVAQNGASKGATVLVADGIYYLPETIKFSPSDSGSEGKPVVYKAINEGKAVLSGGMLLDLEWSEWKDGIYKAATPEGLDLDQLFINGEQQRMARFPNYNAELKDSPYQGYAADAFSKERAAGWADPKGGYIHAMHRGGWGGYHYEITGKDASGEVTFEGGWQNNRKSTMHVDHRMVENIFEELDAEKEWFHDQKTNTLYYKPFDGLSIKDAKVEVVRLRHIVEFNGSEESPVKHITFDGFTVRHAARTFMDTNEQLVRSDWAIYRGGAFFLTGTEDIQILNSEFDQVGGNAIFVSNYSRNVTVKGCHIHHTGASGVCFVGSPEALYNPLFEYGERNDLTKIDLTKGPKSNKYPMGGVVEDCLIHKIGTVERQPAGVQIEMAAKIRVSDVSVYDCARAGINIGDGAFGGHIIERCDVFSTVLETHDHGSFNSWGRDRYWRADHLTASQKAVDANPELPFLDAIYTTVIRDSRWRCEHGWDVDLDDGSTNYDIYNNLMLCGGLKLREGFRRRAWNNIIVNNGLSSHVWFSNSNDEVFSNVIAQARTPYVLEGADVRNRVFKNFYYNSSEAQLKKCQDEYDWDHGSKVGENPFVDEANGDFTVKEGSKAFEVGFKNFPMDQFGVKKPSLKAIAKTPKFTPKAPKKVEKKKEASAEDIKYTWLGSPLKGLKGNEFSAYGVTKEDGGIVMIKVESGSQAQQFGLQSNDLVQKVNGHNVKHPKDLLEAVAAQAGKSFEVMVVRNQQEVNIKIEPNSEVIFESANSAAEFKTIALKSASSLKLSSHGKTREDSLSTLTDGKLIDSFGSVFVNSKLDGAYKIDLGASQKLQSISAYSFKRSEQRGIQFATVLASNAATDPGWDLSKYTELAVVLTPETNGRYNASRVQGDLGTYRWIVWRSYPISSNFENTSYQEFSVEVAE